MDSSNVSNNKKKSIVLTILVYALFILLLFFIRFWPPSDAVLAQLGQGGGGGGVTVNFGDSDFGQGKDYTSQVLDISNTVTAIATPTNTVENILSSEVSDQTDYAIVSNPTKVEKKETKVIPTEKPVVITPEKPKVSESTNSALANLLGGNATGGDGNDGVAGNKGKLNGTVGSSDYYGSGGSGGGTGGGHGTGNGTGTGSGTGPGSGGGSGGGSGYSLGNRKALTKPEPKYTCNESGRVVVEVTVDRNGKTINAVPGVKGSTNLAKCLLDQAKLAAMATKWQSSDDAPAVQTGQIIYNFSFKNE